VCHAGILEIVGLPGVYPCYTHILDFAAYCAGLTAYRAIPDSLLLKFS